MKKNINEIIAKVLAGESSQEDEITLIGWLGEDTENLREFTEREKLWNSIEIAIKHKEYNPDSAISKFRSQTLRHSSRNIKQPPVLKRILKSSLSWAAIGLTLITLGSAITYILIDRMNQPEAAVYEVTVPSGSRSNITLADGTSVWLNGGSRLSYNMDFGSRDRTVHLEGEGYFNVAKSQENPFTVITSQLEIVALGTSFNVKSYPEENIIQATLISGSAMVSRSEYKLQERGVVLEPNQQVTYYKESGQVSLLRKPDTGPATEETIAEEKAKTETREPPKIILRRGINPEVFISWKDNRLIFDDEPFESIAVKLERRFGAKIIIKDDEIKNRKFKGQFDEITIEQALSALKFASPFEYNIQHDTIYISSQ